MKILREILCKKEKPKTYKIVFYNSGLGVVTTTAQIETKFLFTYCGPIRIDTMSAQSLVFSYDSSYYSLEHILGKLRFKDGLSIIEL